MTEDKMFIIDPLTTLCKLALLYLLPEKTKLSIGGHILCIQEPTFYQGLQRLGNRDYRTDLSYLNAPLYKAMKWYLLDNTDREAMEESSIANVKTITRFAVAGLSKLQKGAYKNDMCMNVILQYFINMLTNALDDEWNEKYYVTDFGESVLTNKIRSSYEKSTIESIAKMLGDAQNADSDLTNKTLSTCISKMLDTRDVVFIQMMKDINTIL
jgi:hypothetical protein